MTTVERRTRVLAVVMLLLASVLLPVAAQGSPRPVLPRPHPVTATATGEGATASVPVEGRRRAPRLTRLVVVDHNVERRASAVGAAVRRAGEAGARLLTLQEVCWWQARDLRAKHPSWSIVYQPDTHSGRCREQSALGLLSTRDDSGNVVVWTGGRRARASTHVFRHQPRRSFSQGVACLHWRRAVALDVCSTHLVHAGMSRARKGVQLGQAREVDQVTRRWTRRGHLVVLGGDFNAAPSSRTLDHLYRVNGQGGFVEATGCQPGVDRCRRSRGVTLDKGQQKIDYLFFSANRTPPGSPHGLTLTRTLSDHLLLTGWARVDLRPARRGAGQRA